MVERIRRVVTLELWLIVALFIAGAVSWPIAVHKYYELKASVEGIKGDIYNLSADVQENTKAIYELKDSARK